VTGADGAVRISSVKGSCAAAAVADGCHDTTGWDAAMVTPPEIEARILRLYHAEKWLIGTIAQQLHVHYSVVGRVLAQAGLPRHVTAVPHWSDGCSRWRRRRTTWCGSPSCWLLRRSHARSLSRGINLARQHSGNPENAPA
jgi:hypothetical protein